jgi:universal stress protein A
MILARKENCKMKTVTEKLTPKKDSSVRPDSIPLLSLKHVLAPTDFSQNSEKAVSYAVQLAKLIGAKLTLLHVVPEPSPLDYPMGGIPATEMEGWQEEAKKRLADELSRAKLDYGDVDSVQTTALHPSDKIVEVATSLGADILVLSTHGYKGWKHMLLGSHAEKILKEAPCPVLIVR